MQLWIRRIALPILLVVVFSMNLAGQSSSPHPARVSRSHGEGVSITLTPGTLSIGTGANQQFTATVSGSSDHDVTWQVNGISGGDSTYGTVDGATQLYFAPVTVPRTSTFTITATAVADTSKRATAQVTVLANDPLGSISKATNISCPGGGIAGATCKKLTVNCDNVASISAYLKISYPAGTSAGVVQFGIGTGGSGLYESAYTSGQTAVQNVLNAGYTTVQVSFGSPFTSSQPNGWLQGPGGVRRLACRYATVTQWVHDNILTAAKPLCATGNSGGGSAIGYALSEYGLSGVISMAEVTSGPPMSRIDTGCLCNAGTYATLCGQGALGQCYGLANASVIDPAYSTPLCSNAVNGHPRSIDATLFLSDSINAQGGDITFSKTYVKVLLGGQDSSSAVPFGLQWYDQITSSGQKAQACVTDAPHSMPNALDAANQISNDLIDLCRIQP
jgi:hypothetical protein